MQEERKIVRLAKPVKKGLLHLVFSRFFILLMLFIFQIGIFIALFTWLPHLSNYFATAQTVFTAFIVIYLFNNTMDSSAKLTWMFLIAILPLPGAALLLFTQTDLGHRKLKERVDARIAETKHALLQPPGVLEELEQAGDGTEDLAHYLNRSGCFPVYHDTQVTYFPLGEDEFPLLLEELEKAEQYIFLESFIIEEGYMWGRILDVLMRKADAGVDVRVLYDGMCEMFWLPHAYWKLLRAHGISAQPFAPIRPIVSSQYNYRDHRKILVIDGKVAFTGGINYADEYINRIERFGHWKDTSVMLKGSAARSFALMFLQLWNSDDETSLSLPPETGTPASASNPDGYVIPYCDCPLDAEKVGEAVYMEGPMARSSPMPSLPVWKRWLISL